MNPKLDAPRAFCAHPALRSAGVLVAIWAMPWLALESQVVPTKPTVSPQAVRVLDIRPISDIEVQGVIQILRAQATGNVARVDSAMRAANFDIGRLERRLARISYIMFRGSSKRAERQFSETASATYLDPRLKLTVKRAEFPNWRLRLNKKTEEEYALGGGQAVLAQDEKVVAKYEDELAPLLARLYMANRERA